MIPTKPNSLSLNRVPVGRGLRGGFSLIEILVAVTLMSVIILGLLAMFGQTQRAFRAGITQVDVMEAGRSALEMSAREVEQNAPIGMSNSINFYAGWSGYFLELPLPGKSAAGIPQWRTNILQNLMFTVRDNQTWSWIGYGVIFSNYLGTLYRYQTNAAAIDVGAFVTTPPGPNPFANTNSQAQVVDNVVDFRVLPYDAYGRLLTPYNIPPKAVNEISVTYTNPLGDFSYNYTFRSNAVPAYVEIELGILEAKTAERARNLPPSAQYGFLTNQVGHVQIFRQRIPIRNVDPSVYQ